MKPNATANGRRIRARPPPTVRELLDHFTATEMNPRPQFDAEAGKVMIKAAMESSNNGPSPPTSAAVLAVDFSQAVPRQNDLCLEALQLLVSSRHRSRSRQASPRRGLSAPRSISHPRDGHEAVMSGGGIPAMQPDIELAPSSGKCAPRPPPPRALSGTASRPSTVAARPLGNRASPAAAVATTTRPRVSRFFSDAVKAASEVRELTLPTRIPEECWMMDTTPFSTSDQDQVVGYHGNTGSTRFARRSFPSVKPNSKAEVAQLAQCLDAMLAMKVPNDAVLLDAEAFFAFPPLVEPAQARADVLLALGGASPSGSPPGGRHDNIDTGPADPYLVAAEALLEVCDVGMCETVRHVASSSVTLASLLDNLRSVAIDVCRNCTDYVAAAKSHVEEQHRMAEALKAQLVELQNRFDERALQHGAVSDELARVVAERDELQRLLDEDAQEQEREDFFGSLAAMESQRLAEIDTLQASVISGLANTNRQMKVSLDVPEEDASHSRPRTPAARDGAHVHTHGAPTAALQSSVRGRRRSTAGLANTMTSEGDGAGLAVDSAAVYGALIPFLHTVHKTVTATDAACTPFFGSTLLSQPQLGVSVASSRWASLAAIVGAFENSQDRKSTTHDSEALATAALAKYLHEARSAGAVRSATLSAADVLSVLREVTGTMTEVAVRLTALSESAELSRVSKPELMPPLEPDAPCPLCYRVQAVGPAQSNGKGHLIGSDVVELVAAPLREEIAVLREELTDAANRDAATKKKLEECRAKVRALESEKLRESTQVAGRPLDSNAASGAFQPAPSLGSVTIGSPLQLSLVINCRCCDGSTAAAPPSTARPSSREKRVSPGQSPSPVVMQGGARPSSGRAPRSGAAVAKDAAETGSIAAESPTVLSPTIARAAAASYNGSSRRSVASKRFSPHTEQALSIRSADEPIIVASEISPTEGEGTVLSEDELRRLIDLDQTRYRFPLFATSRDARVLLTLGTAAPHALAMNPTKTLTWALKQISALYRSKLMHDMTADFERLRRRSMPDYILNVALRLKYGDPKLVNDAAASLLSACQGYQVDERVDLFARFVAEYYTTAVLHACLRLQRALDDVSYGPEYSLACNDDAVDHRHISVLVVKRVTKALLARPDWSAAERHALSQVDGHAVYYSELATHDAAFRAMGRGAISAKTMARWTAAEREDAYRIVPRSRVLSRFCEDLKVEIEQGDARAAAGATAVAAFTDDANDPFLSGPIPALMNDADDAD